MRSFASFRLGPLGSFSVHHSISSESDRPPGVSAERWIRLEENLGIVVIPPAAGSASSGTPVASGQLMLKHNGYWLRLQLENPPAHVTPVQNA